MTHALPRRRALLLAAPVAALAAPRALRAQPSAPRPLRAVVPFPPGGGVDVFARALAPALSAALGGQPVVVENIGGASSRLGAQNFARTAADGSAVLITNDTLAAVEALPLAGFAPALPHLAPLALGASAPHLLVAHPRAGLPTAEAYAERLRGGGGARPPYVGIPGLGTAQHFASELIAHALGGNRPEHVTYRGGGPLVTDLLAGHGLDAAVVTLGAAAEHVRDGRLLGLAVTSPERSPALPQVPALAERLAPGFAVTTWMGVLAHAAAPPPLLEALGSAALAAARDPALAARLGPLGFETPALGADAFGAALRDTHARFAAIAQLVGMRAGEA